MVALDLHCQLGSSVAGEGISMVLSLLKDKRVDNTLTAVSGAWLVAHVHPVVPSQHL